MEMLISKKLDDNKCRFCLKLIDSSWSFAFPLHCGHKICNPCRLSKRELFDKPHNRLQIQYERIVCPDCNEVDDFDSKSCEILLKKSQESKDKMIRKFECCHHQDCEVKYFSHELQEYLCEMCIDQKGIARNDVQEFGK